MKRPRPKRRVDCVSASLRLIADSIYDGTGLSDEQAATEERSPSSISEVRAISQALPRPTIPGTLSVPARRTCSCPLPTICILDTNARRAVQRSNFVINRPLWPDPAHWDQSDPTDRLLNKRCKISYSLAVYKRPTRLYA